ncbi:MAG: SDR family oxidoreductase [Thermoleophilia bacterium]|nr:SDR family oxidoreductase [Thermoleophilia bacterium]
MSAQRAGAGGRTALVTGGGSGIGAAVARRLASEGYSVALVGRRPGPLGSTAEDVRRRGASALTCVADVGEAAEMEAAVEASVQAFGGLDLLVNNAGIGDSGPALEEEPAGWDAVLRTNLTGAFLAARAGLPHLIARGGSIVNVASVSGFLAGPGWTSYCTSKAGLVMLTRCLANDYGPAGVRTNCVCPGWVRTAMGDEDMDAVARLHGTDREGAYRLVHENHPARRPADPEEVAAVVSFLAGADASYVNGVALPVDGGAMVVDPTATATLFRGSGEPELPAAGRGAAD